LRLTMLLALLRIIAHCRSADIFAAEKKERNVNEHPVIRMQRFPTNSYIRKSLQ
jgi:hypothetical protein